MAGMISTKSDTTFIEILFRVKLIYLNYDYLVDQLQRLYSGYVRKR